jgi:hypothetical protein
MEYELDSGQHFFGAVRDIIALLKKHKEETYVFTFNDTDVTIRPGSDPSDIYTIYQLKQLIQLKKREIYRLKN